MFRWLLLIAIFIVMLALWHTDLSIRDSRIRSLEQQLKNEQIDRQIEAGRLDLVCERAPDVCLNIE